MNDSSLDREIESLVASEPSPEFVARVRTRVANEAAPGRWRASWMFAAAGATVVVIVTVIAWPSPEPTSSTVPEPTARMTQADTVSSPALPVVPAPERRQIVAAKAVARAVQLDRTIEIDLPDVVIAENETRTFAALVASVRQSRFDAAVPAVPDPDTPLEIKRLPPVEPLEIEPILRVAVLQAEGERP